MKRSICLCALICICFFSYAQQYPLSFHHLSRVDGLSNDVNSYVYKDSRGFVWISSIDGLNRFDGQNVKSYRPDIYSDNAIADNIVSSNFFEDDNSNIWFSTYGAVNCYLRAFDHFVSFTLKGENGDLLTEDYRAFHLDDKNQLWVRTGIRENGQLHLFNIKSEVDSIVTSLGGQRNYYLKDFRDNTEYVISSLFDADNGLEILKLGADKSENTVYFKDPQGELPTERTFNVYAESIDKIFFGAETGLGLFSAQNQVFQLFETFKNKPIGRVWAIAPLGNNYLLVTSRNAGLLIFDKSVNGFVYAYTYKDDDVFSLRANQNFEVYVDNSNCVWVSNWGKGLDYACFGKSKFEILDVGSEAEQIDITSITNDAHGKIWSALGDQGIVIFNDDKSIEKRINPLATLEFNQTSRIEQLYFDRQDRLWMIIRDLEARISHVFFQNPTDNIWIEAGQSVSTITSIFQLSNKRILVTTKLGVKEVLIEDSQISLIPCKELEEHNKLPFYKIHQDFNNHIYFSANFDRILVYDLNDNDGMTYTADLTQVGNAVSYWNTEEENNMWVASTAGLVIINSKNLQYEIFNHQFGGLNYESMYALSLDSKDRLWIKTQADLIKYDIRNGNIRRYGTTDGIQTNASDDLKAIPLAQDTSGFIWLAGPEGITYFHPDSIFDFDVQAQPQITDIFVNAEPINSDTFVGEISTLFLPFDQNTISLNFVACEYSDPTMTAFRYRMKDYDPDWVESGNLSLARYANVPWGEYRFEVQAANSDGVWSENTKSLGIIINPPWWATWWAYGLYALLLAYAGWRLHLFQKKRLLRAEHEKQREKELEHAQEIQVAYTDLKNTQQQLIQSEKMASLGEVTAGIAHEMQNPLNFVNNFSEISNELVEEMYEELDKGDIDEAKAIATDLQKNLDRINRHGRRAEGIVKSLLEHSRAGSREKSEVNINAMCDEFLRLTYRNVHSKDGNFRALFSFDYDPKIPKIKVVPQEIGTVLLNIFNNAFYAVNERRLAQAKSVDSPSGVGGKKWQNTDNSYEPCIDVSTKKRKNKIEIRIEDNGGGIPEEIIDKIFQPFFTTKPTGQATGLGLSLSYDIVKAHGGNLKVKTKTDEETEEISTEFTIELPLKA